jgi:hypothetical protein
LYVQLAELNTQLFLTAVSPNCQRRVSAWWRPGNHIAQRIWIGDGGAIESRNHIASAHACTLCWSTRKN